MTLTEATGCLGGCVGVILAVIAYSGTFRPLNPG